MAGSVEFSSAAPRHDGSPRVLAKVLALDAPTLEQLGKVVPETLRLDVSEVINFERLVQVRAREIVSISNSRQPLEWLEMLSPDTTTVELFGLFGDPPSSLSPSIAALTAPWAVVKALLNGRALDGVRHLYVDGYQGEDLSYFRGLAQLRSLRLDGAARLRDFGGLDDSTPLEALDVGPSPHASLDGLDEIESLRELSLNGLRGTDFAFDFVSSLPNLEALNLEDCGRWSECSPLGRASALRRLGLTGNTTISDGDLSALARSTFDEVSIAARRHYRPTVAVLNKAPEN